MEFAFFTAASIIVGVSVLFSAVLLAWRRGGWGRVCVFLVFVGLGPAWPWGDLHSFGPAFLLRYRYIQLYPPPVFGDEGFLQLLPCGFSHGLFIPSIASDFSAMARCVFSPYRQY